MEVEIQKQQQQGPRCLPPVPRLDPWLIFLHGRRGHNQTFFTLSENRYHVKNIPEMRRKYIATSSYGWMLLLDDFSDDCPLLLNPTSMEKILLPPWGTFTYDSCLLTSPPNDPSCTVLFMNKSQGLVSFMYCKPSDDNWVYQDVAIKDDKLEEAVCCDGKIYGYLGESKMLLIIDVGTTITIKEFGGEAIPQPLAPDANVRQTNLVESCGELYVIFMIYMGIGLKKPLPIVRHIEVFKMDFVKKVWVRVKSLGDQAFFIGHGFTSCSATKSRIKGNTIYFILPEDRSLYAFNLEERSMTVSLPCPNVKNRWSEARWVLPLA